MCCCVNALFHMRLYSQFAHEKEEEVLFRKSLSDYSEASMECEWLRSQVLNVCWWSRWSVSLCLIVVKWRIWIRSGSTLVCPHVPSGWVLSSYFLSQSKGSLVGLIGSSHLSLGFCHSSLCVDPVVTSGDKPAPGGTLPCCLKTAGIQDPGDPLLCRGGSDRKRIDGWIIGNVDWSPLGSPYLCWSSVSNWSRFLFINIRPLLASLLITLLFGLTLRRSLIEWPEVTMLIDWVKITLTWVTHTVIKLGSDFFDTRSRGRQQKLGNRLARTCALMTHYWISDFHRARKTWETRMRNFSGRVDRKSVYLDLRSSTKPHAGSQLT